MGGSEGRAGLSASLGQAVYSVGVLPYGWGNSQSSLVTPWSRYRGHTDLRPLFSRDFPLACERCLLCSWLFAVPPLIFDRPEGGIDLRGRAG